ncbi:MAG: hypothetical protein A3F84_17200 [Candidatus Handelsmanbacteria bacterium RIFCSPLOWO2_12_FULL_64_10]|uniref:t-SNARE coiled-coil homology domain-containing protein n=1 Tax=Handelsmanbacteria sp. (strain RIFCSPLOWO2_12_FULL_64_10) TaxID=1817868 RepID=A0A1F6C9Q2_HANXR|nr:MAG: hypothetical protein A3F84_17200 [Candidatus Handelsmanbacteria bacterium RIFCSPLOWO2_12_FULL_64_10]
MAEERGATIGDALEGRLDRLEQGMAELKGTVSQMDKRLSNVETAVNELRRDNKQAFLWLLGILLGTWMSTMWAILSKIR